MNIIDTPLISIITTVKNGEKHLEQTILSVINQSYKNIEYIIVDGKSTDNTINIIKKYENKITKWISEKDNGIYNGMNKGVNMATGKYFAILNSDDYYLHKDVISIIGNYIIKQNPDALHANAIIKKLDGTTKEIKGSQNKILYTNTIIHPTLFSKKELFIKYGGFNEKYTIAADLDYSLNLIRNKHNLFKIEEYLVNIRQCGISFTSKLKKPEGFLIRKSHYKKNYKLILIYIFFVSKELVLFIKNILKSTLK